MKFEYNKEEQNHLEDYVLWRHRAGIEDYITCYADYWRERQEIRDTKDCGYEVMSI